MPDPENPVMNGVLNPAFEKETDTDVRNGQSTPTENLTEDQRKELMYDIYDTVPWPMAFLMGFQHYLTMAGSSIAIPLIITPLLCIEEGDPIRGHFISTILFMSGIITFLQTTFGVRLPIVQGGTFAMLAPAFILLKTSFPVCAEVDLVNMTDEERVHEWQIRIREIQGAIILACLCEVAISATGLLGFVLKWVTPLSIAPTITLIGLSLFSVAAEKSSENWLVSIMTMALFILFSQYLPEYQPRVPSFGTGRKIQFKRYPIFKSFPILLGLITSWAICAILTVSGALKENSLARTDIKNDLIAKAPWFVFPYPFQYGMPTFSLAGFLGMMSGVLASTIESIGDYYACAKISGAPLPPVHAVNRGIFVEGIGGILAGIWGTGNGTTSYSENIGALRITRVANNRVIQAGSILMILFGILGKFGAFCATIPGPLVGGLFVVMFSIITAVGLSNLQMVNLNSSRNLFVLGFSLFFGLAFPKWVEENPGALNIGVPAIDQVTQVIFTTSMFVGGGLGFILDNTIPGTREERGIDRWNNSLLNNGESDTGSSVYDLPLGMGWIRKATWLRKFPISPTFGS